MARLDELESLLPGLRAMMDEADPKSYAGLSREYRAVLAEIDELRPPEKRGDSVDEIAARRAARGRTRSLGEDRASGSV